MFKFKLIRYVSVIFLCGLLLTTLSAQVELKSYLYSEESIAQKTSVPIIVDDVLYNADLLFQKSHSMGSYSWTGKIQGEQYGYLILSYYKGTLFGKVELDGGLSYQFRKSPQQRSLVLVDPDLQAENENCSELSDFKEPMENQPPQVRSVDVCDPASNCPDQVLSIAVFFNDIAESNLGGNSAAIAAITTAVDEINVISQNSQVSHEFDLVHASLINYTESGDYSTDLSRLRDDNDGFMDEVHDIRDESYADLVALILSNAGGCGIGYVNTNPNQYNAQAAFSVTSNSCMTGNKTLAHEVGHNMGFRHDRYVNTGTPVCPYALGWVNPGAQGGSSSERWRTVMAYNRQCVEQWGFNCSRIAHWSNPDVLYNGDPTGSAIGNSDESHNVHVIDRAACQVQEFRVPVDCDSCVVFQECATYNSNTNDGPGNTTDITIPGPFPDIDTNGPDPEICIYYFGDHSWSTERFNILDENNSILGTTSQSNDCNSSTRICFTISPADYEDWTSDDQVTISLDPVSTDINPSLCSANRACAELVVYDTLDSCPLMVTSSSNSGPGSLREMLNCAQLGDTITFSADLAGAQIELGLPAIIVDDQFYLAADFSDNITLTNSDPNSSEALFEVSGELSIMGLKVTGQNNSTFIIKINNGGTIIVNEADLDKITVLKE